MSPQFSEWPTEADVYRLTDGEWKWYGSIRSHDHAQTWIAKRDNPDEWKSVPREDTE